MGLYTFSSRQVTLQHQMQSMQMHSTKQHHARKASQQQTNGWHHAHATSHDFNKGTSHFLPVTKQQIQPTVHQFYNDSLQQCCWPKTIYSVYS